MGIALQTLVKKVKLQNVSQAMLSFMGERGPGQLTFSEYVLSLERMEIEDGGFFDLEPIF